MYDPRNTHTQLTIEVTFLRNRVEYRLGRDFPTADKEDRKDAMGDAWLAMCEHNLLYYLDTRNLALKWLWQVSKNRLLDILKEKRPELYPEHFDVGAEDNSILTFEARQQIEAFLATRPPEDRRLYEVLAEGLSPKEAAEVLCLKLNTLHVKRERSSKKFKRFSR